MVITLPPIGWNIHSIGLLLAGIVAACIPIVAMILWSDKVWKDPNGGGPWLYIALPLVFAIAFILCAVAFKARQGTITLAGRKMLIADMGQWFTKRHEFDLNTLDHCEIGLHFLSMPDTPFPVLHLFPVKGRKTAAFAGRSDRETEWLVDVINTAIRTGRV